MELSERVKLKLKQWACERPHTFHGYETEKFYNLVIEARHEGIELTEQMMHDALVMHNSYTDAVNKEVAEKYFRMYNYIIGFLEHQAPRRI